MMETLTEHNERVAAENEKEFAPRPNWQWTGIACDKCGSELLNRAPRGGNLVLEEIREGTEYKYTQVKAPVYCPECGAEGLRFV